MKSTRGTSLTEVMVMMVILSISIVGIYTMVNSGQQLATLTDTRLKAINIAREGLESVATLRDTFALKGFEPGECTASPLLNAFFSINEDVLTGTPSVNCPQIGPKYILQDDKKLVVETTNHNVCINEFGWYSQEKSISSLTDISNCSTGNVGNPCTCANTLTLCGNNVTQSCKTKFQREITFAACTVITSEYCINVISKVTWGSEADESLELNQILTRLN